MKLLTNDKNVLSGVEWMDYYKAHSELEYMKSYKCTHNYVQIHKAGDYYFTFGIKKGYKNITSLKRLIY